MQTQTSHLSRVMVANKAVFLDKDGTLVTDVPYNVNPDLISLSENMTKGLKSLAENGYKLIVISNQSGVAMGFFEHDSLEIGQKRISMLLAEHGVEITDFYYCPHHPQGIVNEYKKKCNCRKPRAGLLYKAAEEHHIDLGKSWLIGDILDDIEAGNVAGCKTVLINNGNETEWKTGLKRIPDCMVSDINGAADYILEVPYSIIKENE